MNEMMVHMITCTVEQLHLCWLHMPHQVVHCRAEACMSACQKHGVHDGEAFLLERLGDVTAALNLYVRNIERCNASFVVQALQGHVQLPNVAASGSR